MKFRDNGSAQGVRPKTKRMIWPAAALLLAAGTSGLFGAEGALTAMAEVDKSLKAATECAELQREDFSRIPEAATTVLSTEVVAAQEGSEEYCAVKGYIQPQIQFEMRLPTKTWNGRYFQAGCGGFCGKVNIRSCADALAQNFAVAAENMGHVSGQDGMWGSDTVLRMDFGLRSAHVMAVVGKVIVERYYGKRAAYSYFQGCSTGGREGLGEAQYYPEDFDGIIAGDPAFPTRQGGMSNNWFAHQLNKRNGGLVFPPEKLEFLHAAVVKKCDRIDGLADGIIVDPRNCDFDIESLACSGDRDAPDCLTAPQLASAKKLYGGPRDSKGQRLYPGNAMPGSELAWQRSLDANYSNQFLRYLAFVENPPLTYTYWDFDFDMDIAKLEAMAAVYDPVVPYEDPDLNAFRRAGGKLIVYHGWADASVSPLQTLDYYAEVAQREGGIDQVQDWFRVFMVPGMLHCRGGNAPNTFDMFSAIRAWVEHGKAPDRIVASQFDENGKLIRNRPLFPYPSVARYSGKGDVNDAVNWEQASPSKKHEDDIKWVWDPN